MIKCPQCGTNNIKGSSYCTNCGYLLQAEKEPAFKQTIANQGSGKDPLRLILIIGGLVAILVIALLIWFIFFLFRPIVSEKPNIFRTITPLGQTLIPSTKTITPSGMIVSPQPIITSTSLPGVFVKDGIEMILIPAGEFQMGAIDGDASADSDEKPRHPVYLDAFWIDKHEVTNRAFMKCVDAGVCRYQKPQWINPQTGSERYGASYPDFPAIYVNWENADKYCRWVGERLPTEAEWEKAARGTHTNVLYPWGNDLPDQSRANFARYFASTREVGTLPGGNSSWGVQDLAGNVWEWVADWYSGSYPSGLQTNPTGPSSGATHVIRGGSWFSPSKDIRISARSRPQSLAQEVLGSGNWGFRCAMDALNK